MVRSGHRVRDQELLDGAAAGVFQAGDGIHDVARLLRFGNGNLGVAGLVS